MHKIKRLTQLACAITFVFSLGVASNAYAAVTNAYEATMTPHYANPATGQVEDSGGEESMAIGEGMVQGATSSDAYVEVEENGTMYATVRLVLMDNVSNVVFYIDETPVHFEEIEQNAQVSDFRFQIPNENAIIKTTMFVEPMGRDVVFFMTLSNFVPLENTNVQATASQSASSASASEDAQKIVSKAKDKKKKSDKKDDLTPKRNDATAKIFKLENLSKNDKTEFSNKIKSAKEESEIEAIVAEAESADKDAAVENALGKAKTEALQTISGMENLTEDQKLDFKGRVKNAESEEEVALILDEANQQKPNRTALYIGVGVVVLALGGAGVAYYVVKRKKPNNEQDA